MGWRKNENNNSVEMAPLKSGVELCDLLPKRLRIKNLKHYFPWKRLETTLVADPLTPPHRLLHPAL